MARIAASAVSATGRARRIVENTIASRRVSPRSRTSVSIWSTRMTVLRMSMPASAISPSSATKPNGLWARLSAIEAPTMPSGAVKNTIASREKLCIWIISSVSMVDDHDREQHEDRAVALLRFLDRAAHLDAIARRQRFADRGELRPERVRDVGRLRAVGDVAERDDDDLAVLAPDDRLLGRAHDMRDLADRDRDAVARRDREVADAVERRALAGDGARDDVDALLAGAHRRHRRAADQRLQGLRDVLRRQAEGACARLIDLEPERGHRLAPVEMRVDDAIVARASRRAPSPAISSA